MLVRVVALVCLWMIAAPAAAQGPGSCTDEVRAWAEECHLRVASCPSGHVILLAGANDLSVDVTKRDERAFVAVGPFGVSPIGEFPDWHAAPHPTREAFDSVVECLRTRPGPVLEAVDSPPPRITRWLVRSTASPVPWRALLGLALAFALVARRFGPRRLLERALPLVALGATVMLARRLLVPEAYFHQNGQGPMWIAHALGDPSNYGPGYTELFQLVARSAADPDGAVFFLQSALCALVPPGAFVIARAAGASRAIAWAAAIAVALSPIEARLARSESFFACCGALLMIAAAVLGVGVRPRELRASVLASVAAGLLVAQAARVHPLCWLAAALLPLVVLVGPGAGRARPAVIGAAVIALTVLATAGLDLYRVVAGPLGESWLGPAQHGDGRAVPVWIVLLALIAAGSALGALRVASARRLLCALAGLATVIVVAWRSNLLGAAPPWVHEAYRWLYLGPALAAAAALVEEAIARVPEARARLARRGAAPLVLGLALAYHAATFAVATRMPTDAREALLVRSWRASLPAGAAVAYLSRAERQIVGLPLYEPRHRPLIAGAPIADLSALGGDVFYVRTSLCTSERGRAACDAIERGYVLEPLRRAVLPAIASMRDLEHDRAEVEIVLYRVRDRRSASTTHEGSSEGREGR